ncbi:Kinesin-like protein [Schistosoma japonicum]|uniref:Kinesin-like protein n=1 Tax=Schistosoma japonicum TaxID=6182 RepID=A0A4Z2DKF2_SCHJA|nr:Kinesin-like protein [Schistosoma japonicum]TNN16640.1 Kinesin-like protein [Schistosoma japonicum]TNN16641.1 Kinesin-like protein [Schistosoma japonicum]
MVKQTIQIYLRLRPSPRHKQISKYNIDDLTHQHYQRHEKQQQSSKKPKITFECLRDTQHDEIVCNRKEFYNFQFDAIFDANIGQDQVFNDVAKPVIEKALLGYNGTIFAYGQTGSGKTYTITGGAERYSERGIIPRCLAYLFDHFEKELTSEYTLKISYMEIYNEIGYDLLDSRHHSTTRLEDLPRVILFEHTEAGTVHLKNLSIHSASTTDEALNLLFMGDTNRIIAETPMNQASTRSHCIFTMHITSRVHGSSVIRRSKLHLVDLAGSERVYKYGLDGTLLTEAKYINLSLHYLEQVIIALAEKQRTHVPYRNSMMTMMLRDSLGGNCMTSMIATCSIEQENLQETISTCRFAQRVALIKNEVILNEEQDPYLTISYLKSEIEHLKAELAFTTGVNNDTTLNIEDREKCEKLIQEFLTTSPVDKEVHVPAQILSNIHMINLGFSVVHELYWKNIKKLESIKTSTNQVVVPPFPNSTKEANQLRDILAQRDHEIRVLVNLLKQEKQRNLQKNYSSELYTNSNIKQHSSINHNTNKESTVYSLNDSYGIQNQFNIENDKNLEESTMPNKNILLDESKRAVDHVTKWLEQQAKGKLLGQLSLGREEAFNVFKQDYPLQDQINTQKEQLKSLYAEAKLQGGKMREAKEEVGNLRVQLNSLMQNDQNDLKTQQLLAELRHQLELKRTEYRDSYSALKELKPRVEHLQHSLELAKMRLVQNFESWWNQMSIEKTDDITTDHQLNESAILNSSISLDNVKLNDTNSVNSTEDKTLSESLNQGQTDLKVNKSSCGNLYGNREMDNKSMNYSIPMTGDPVVDADILTFIRAREKIRLRRLHMDQQSKSQCIE